MTRTSQTLSAQLSRRGSTRQNRGGLGAVDAALVRMCSNLTQAMTASMTRSYQLEQKLIENRTLSGSASPFENTTYGTREQRQEVVNNYLIKDYPFTPTVHSIDQTGGVSSLAAHAQSDLLQASLNWNTGHHSIVFYKMNFQDGQGLHLTVARCVTTKEKSHYVNGPLS